MESTVITAGQIVLKTVNIHRRFSETLLIEGKFLCAFCEKLSCSPAHLVLGRTYHICYIVNFSVYRKIRYRVLEKITVNIRSPAKSLMLFVHGISAVANIFSRHLSKLFNALGTENIHKLKRHFLLLVLGIIPRKTGYTSARLQNRRFHKSYCRFTRDNRLNAHTASRLSCD